MSVLSLVGCGANALEDGSLFKKRHRVVGRFGMGEMINSSIISAS